MKYNCQKLSNMKAIIEIVPESDNEILLFNNMDKEKPDDDTLYYYYSVGLKLINASAVILCIDSFHIFPTKATISYDLTIGFRS